jgi:hypothetical protein
MTIGFTSLSRGVGLPLEVNHAGYLSLFRWSSPCFHLRVRAGESWACIYTWYLVTNHFYTTHHQKKSGLSLSPGSLLPSFKIQDECKPHFQRTCPLQKLGLQFLRLTVTTIPSNVCAFNLQGLSLLLLVHLGLNQLRKDPPMLFRANS